MEKRVAERTTELASARDDLSKALRQERELGELKTRFVTMVSHEFRTPLGITMSAIELMRHYDDRLPVAQRKELYEDIYRATRQMGGLMEQVLVLGRVESGTLTCRNAPVDLEILAQKLADESLSVMNRRCPIEWQALTPLEGARGDETLIRHIFSNLLSNAAKYSPPGNLIRFTARREDEDAVLTVQDQGIGIPEEDRAKLFMAFHRGSNVGEAPGTGLGLVIVNRCVDQHGGSLELSSTPGQGTTFTVRLPLYRAASAAPSSMVPDTTA
jgi:signal transduction histidine kinase